MAQFTDIEIETSENVDINLSPLIDMMFLLLIFFMVTSAFVQQTAMDIKKPEATTARDLPEGSISFALTDQDRILYNGDPISINRVRGIVARQQRRNSRPVVVRADKGSRTEALIALIDECKAAGAKNVSVATENRNTAGTD